MKYPLAIEKGNEKEAFGIVVPDIPGCHSAGDTLEDAISEAKIAITAHLEILAADNQPIPFPSEIEEHINNPDYKNRIWFLIDIDLSSYLGKPEKINVSLPSRLIRLIDENVGKSKQFKTRSSFLASGAEILLKKIKK
ncbi:type II toxin-antitoxin system HicB family antitoxin [Acinetobacter baumannii]|nr:type II toxin-antitoxin system HicB family antitoxin [Acinetobacter baumannii]